MTLRAWPSCCCSSHQINATTLLLYGTISANGANGSSPGGAGGAGGSVLVRCQGVLKGNGVLTARGGGGTWTTKTYGGGGGGGRIGVWYGTSNFSGSFDVRGGVSVYQATTSVDSGAVSKADDWRASFRASSDQRAAGGTVSLQRASGSGLSVVSFRELMAGNQRLATYSSRGNLRGSLSDSSYNPYPSTPTTTLQTNSSYATDVLRLGGGVSLSLRSFTVLNVSTISAAKRPSLLVSQQSRLVVPANFTVNGFTLDLRSGKLQGGGNLTVLGGGVVSLRRDGWTAFEASPGYYRFTRISLRSNASLVLQDGAQVGKRGVVVTAGSVTVARGAKIHSDGRGTVTRPGPTQEAGATPRVVTYSGYVFMCCSTIVGRAGRLCGRDSGHGRCLGPVCRGVRREAGRGRRACRGRGQGRL